MFIFALLLGFYSYSIFILGILHLLFRPWILLTSCIFAVIGLFIFNVTISELLGADYRNKIKKISRLGKICIFLLFIQAAVNCIGVFGPEIGFDALWYHLTLPKLFLLDHSIHHVAGGLLYYSDMPKLAEMYYMVALAFGNEITAKFTHFLFGILILIALYKVSLKFVSKELSLLAAILFYSNLVVGWESISAYVDLARTFFEIMAFWGFIEYREQHSKKWIVVSAIMLGFAISTKLIAFGSLLIITALFLYVFLWSKRRKYGIVNMLLYSSISFLIVFPWLIFSYINTGTPFYPFFTPLYPISVQRFVLNPVAVINEFWILFTSAADPISPIYLIVFPLIFFVLNKFNYKEKLVFFYSLFALIIWYITPHPGSGRFILPYLPVFSILVVLIIHKIDIPIIKRGAIFLIIASIIISIVYRSVANIKFMPYLLGKETKTEFLTKHLNFAYGDYYDTDGYMEKNITQNDRVLLIGFHNLYYVNFPFVDESYRNREQYNYILTHNSVLPKKYIHWKFIYHNDITHINLYTKK